MAWYISGDGNLTDDVKEVQLPSGTVSYKFAVAHNVYKKDTRDTHYYNVEWLTDRRPGTIDLLKKGNYVSIRGAEVVQNVGENKVKYYNVVIRSNNQITVKPKGEGSFVENKVHNATIGSGDWPQPEPPQPTVQPVPQQHYAAPQQVSNDQPPAPQYAPTQQVPPPSTGAPTQYQPAPPGGVNPPGPPPQQNPYE